jgi:hypothetical protein
MYSRCFPKTGQRAPQSERANLNSAAGPGGSRWPVVCRIPHTRTECVPRHLGRVWRRCRRYPILSCPSIFYVPLRQHNWSEELRKGAPSRSHEIPAPRQYDGRPLNLHRHSQRQQWICRNGRPFRMSSAGGTFRQTWCK